MGGWPGMVSLLPALIGVVVSIALLHLWLWLGRRRDTFQLWVAAWCGVTLMFLAGRQMLFNAEFPAAAIGGARLTWLAALALFPVLICLGSSLAGRPPATRVVVAVALINGVLAWLAWTTELFVTRQMSLRHDVLMGVDFLSPLPGPMTRVMAPYIALVFAYVWVTGLRHFAPPSRAERRIVRAGFLLYVLFAINDVLYAARLVPTIRVFDFGFVAVAVGLSYLFIRRHNRLQAQLEDLLGERSRQLEARSAELGALVRAGRILTVGLDREGTLHRIVEEARRITGSEYINLLLLDPNARLLRIGAVSGGGVPADFQVPLGQGFSGTVAATGEPLFVPDTPSDPRNILAERDRAEGIRTYLGLPVKTGSEVLGVLSVSTRSAHVYTDEEIAYLSTFANHAAIAIENARLYAVVRTRLERLETVTRLNRLISSSLDMKHVLKEIAGAAGQLANVEVASFWLAHEETRTLELVGFSSPELEGDCPVRTVTFDEGLSGWVATHRRLLRQDDMTGDPRLSAGGHHWVQTVGLRSYYGLPVIHEGTLLAVLGLLGRQPFDPSPEEESLLQGFVAQAAIAVRNASLYAAEGAARREAELALAQVKQLQGMLPICAYCKKIRNDRNYWESIEGYIGERSQATFSHGVCPECRDTVVAAQMQEYRRRHGQGRAG